MPTLEDLLAGPVAAPSGDAAMPGSVRKELRKMLQAAVGKAEGARARLASLPVKEQRAWLTEGRAAQTLARLRQIPELAEIRVSEGDQLEFITHTMYCREYELGKFRIRLPFGGRYKGITHANGWCQNLTRRVGGYGHPHVDRAGSWCFGDAQEIGALVETCEVEAAVLLTLKSIESVNEGVGGGYDRILSGFPKGRKPKTHPHVAAQVGEGVLEALSHLFNEKTTRRSQEVSVLLDTYRIDARAAQELLASGALTGLLRDSPVRYRGSSRLLGALHTAWLKVNPARSDVSGFARAQMELVRSIDGVTSATVIGDLVAVLTGRLLIRDAAKGESRLCGPFTVMLDVWRGEVTVSSADPLMVGEGTRHAPHLEDPAGSLAATRLSLALPELLGSLELQTAVRMTLDYLTEFDGSRVPGIWLREFRKRDR